jgi:hypothetical protein
MASVLGLVGAAQLSESGVTSISGLSDVFSG